MAGIPSIKLLQDIFHLYFQPMIQNFWMESLRQEKVSALVVMVGVLKNLKLH